MNLNSKCSNHRNICYVATNTIIPDLECTTKSSKLQLLSESQSDDSLYSKYICVVCSPRKRTIAKKDVSSPHYQCIKKCCPLPYHWNLCDQCIQNQHFPAEVGDAKRKMDALNFQRTFSRLPEDIQHLIREYVPNIFAFTKASSRLYLEKTLRNGSRELSQHLKHQTNYVMTNVYGSLRCIYFAEKLSRTSLEKKNKYIREKTQELYELLSDAHQTTIICDEDFWRFRINEGVRCLLRRCEIMQHIQKLLCPTDIRKYFVRMICK